MIRIVNFVENRKDKRSNKGQIKTANHLLVSLPYVPIGQGVGFSEPAGQ